MRWIVSKTGIWPLAASLALALQPAAGLAAISGARSAQWEALRLADLRAAVITFRLVTANVALCDKHMPATGMVLHSISQYDSAVRPELLAAFGFEAPLSVEAVVPSSPAERAGVRPNDGLKVIAGKAAELSGGSEKPSSASRDLIERAIAALPEQQAIDLELLRGGQSLRATIAPVPACRTRFELITGKHGTARSDGETIQLSASYLDRFDDPGLAVILAHELAHTVLDHRKRLAASRSGSSIGGASPARRAEDEADLLSVHLLRNAGYDPAIAPKFLRGPGRIFGSGLFGDGSHGSARHRADAMAAEIARIPPDAPSVYAPTQLLMRRNSPF
jgi:hypothetical protein